MAPEEFHALSREVINETTPTEITPDLLRVAGYKVPGGTPIFIPVRPVIGAALRDCYPNVQLQIEREGGEIVYGWLIFESVGQFFSLVHHAVWKSPTGEHVCVSPQDEPRICFLPDEAKPYQGRFIRGGLYPAKEAEGDNLIEWYCSLVSNNLLYLEQVGDPNRVDEFTIKTSMKMAVIVKKLAERKSASV